MKKLFSITSYVFIALLLVATVAYATTKLTPPGAVANTMYTLSDIYNLSAGTTTTEGSGTIPTTPTTVAPTDFKTLTEVYTAISGELAKLTNAKIAKDVTAFGYTGTLYGDTDPTKVLTTATYAGTANAGGLPKTGQTTCWNTDGSAQAPCLIGTSTDGGQDGYYTKGVALSYTDNLDGTISDGATGLMWKKCSEGKTYTDGSCAGDDATKTWTQALVACEADTTASHTDWRLPNIRELLSIVDYGRVSPAINPLFISQSDYDWSSTTYQYPDNQSVAWSVNFNDGSTNYSNKSGSNYVRCVR